MPDRVDLNEQGFRDLMSSDEVRDYLMDEAGPVVAAAQSMAPKRTGAGAASIRSEPVRDEFGNWTVRVSWTRDRFYMYFHDQGWEGNPGRDFLGQALERVTR